MEDVTTRDGTRERIIDLVEGLVMERGFNAISYQDVADRIAIRKASIHYHFPSKGDLGVAVIERYIEKLGSVAVPVAGLDADGVVAAFDGFLAMFVGVARDGGRVCLGGVLGAEFGTLPQAMQEAVRRFYATAAAWLTQLLDCGRAIAAITPAGDSTTVAGAVLSMLEGALIMARIEGDPARLAGICDMARILCGFAGRSAAQQSRHLA